ncbi:MAG TPA: exodeoxyribonuclease VII large subunit [Vicinamibacterales bacterium]|jgi:exodeoxyribonuclease VII large subunit
MNGLFDLPFEDEEPQATASPAPAQRHVLTVTELTADIRHLLEQRFFEIWVEGELSNCRHWNTGHLYFTLKDAAAQLKGVMFRTSARTLRFKPEDGLHVIARGRIGVYEPKGEYQLICEHLEPQGLGALQLAFEQLKRRLQAEGLFDAARKRPLPALPRKIGIVTSIDGAALRDIINVLRRRYANAHLVIRPARVQGEGAALEIAAALAQIGRVPGVDVVIVGRGGGSIEDLWAFNEEAVARAIVASPVPVISAVGHEIDTTIADFAADLRAPTPSAAAELVVTRKDDFYGRIDQACRQFHVAAMHAIEKRRRRIDALMARPSFAGWPARVALRARDLAALRHRMNEAARAGLQQRARATERLRTDLERRDIRYRIAAMRGRLAGSDRQLATSITRGLHQAQLRLRDVAGRLDTLSPLAVLSRGYAVCWAADGRTIVRDASSVRPGDRVRVRVQHGALDCSVVERAPEEDDHDGADDQGL